MSGWGNDNFRKVVLNALVWLAKGEVPAGGIESVVTKARSSHTRVVVSPECKG